MMRSNRWLQAMFGVIVLMFAGMIYAWSVLSVPIGQEFRFWAKAQLSLTFTIVMIMFCLGQLIYGALAKKITARLTLWISGVLFIIGFLAASKMHSLIVLYSSFGIMCGLASGLAYNGVLSTIIQWFPDKKGLISGILLMGFGIGSFIIGKVYQAFTLAVIGGWRSSFAVLGTALFIVLLVCGFFIKRPPEDFAAPVVNQQKKKVNGGGLDVNSSVMLKMPVFYLYFIWAVVMSAAGLAVISQAVGMIKEIGSNISPGNIATMVGLISIFNGTGRVITGAVYDKLGRSAAMNMANVLFVLTAGFFIFALNSGSVAVLTLGLITAGLAFGGVPTCSSSFISNVFGTTHYPVNFSICNISLIFSSFSSTISGGLYDMTQSYMSTFMLIMAFAAVGIICSLGISTQTKKMPQIDLGVPSGKPY